LTHVHTFGKNLIQRWHFIGLKVVKTGSSVIEALINQGHAREMGNRTMNKICVALIEDDEFTRVGILRLPISEPEYNICDTKAEHRPTLT